MRSEPSFVVHFRVVVNWSGFGDARYLADKIETIRIKRKKYDFRLDFAGQLRTPSFFIQVTRLLIWPLSTEEIQMSIGKKKQCSFIRHVFAQNPLFRPPYWPSKLICNNGAGCLPRTQCSAKQSSQQIKQQTFGEGTWKIRWLEIQVFVTSRLPNSC